MWYLELLDRNLEAWLLLTFGSPLLIFGIILVIAHLLDKRRERGQKERRERLERATTEEKHIYRSKEELRRLSEYYAEERKHRTAVQYMARMAYSLGGHRDNIETLGELEDLGGLKRYIRVLKEKLQ